MGTKHKVNTTKPKIRKQNRKPIKVPPTSVNTKLDLDKKAIQKAEKALKLIVPEITKYATPEVIKDLATEIVILKQLGKGNNEDSAKLVLEKVKAKHSNLTPEFDLLVTNTIVALTEALGVDTEEEKDTEETKEKDNTDLDLDFSLEDEATEENKESEAEEPLDLDIEEEDTTEATDIDELASQQKEMKETLDSVSKKTEEIAEKLEDIAKKIDEIGGEEYKEALEELANAVKDMVGDIKKIDLGAELEQLKKEKEKTEEEKEELEDTVNELTESVERYKKLLESYRKQRAELPKHITTIVESVISAHLPEIIEHAERSLLSKVKLDKRFALLNELAKIFNSDLYTLIEESEKEKEKLRKQLMEAQLSATIAQRMLKETIKSSSNKSLSESESDDFKVIDEDEKLLQEASSATYNIISYLLTR